MIETKARILEAAEPLMLEHGFHAVGLTRILKAVNVPKGSFYHHFESKEAFGVELLRHYVAETTSCKRRTLLETDTAENPLERLFRSMDEGIAKFEQGGCQCPCLIVKLAAEVSSFSEGMRAELSKGFDEWVGIHAELLERAKTGGLVATNLDTASCSQLIHDLWFGAVLRAIASRSSIPLQTARQMLETTLATTPNS
ncbi:MAG: TetR/AcrR family transcriptional regulator [Verrucomicrobiota bacterium]